MKQVKLLLLIVALMLPFRGALAAVGVFCHLGGSADALAQVVQPHHHDVGGDVASHGEHSHAPESHHHSPPQDDASDDDPAPLSDTCTYCSASCGAAPLAPVAASFEAPLPSGAKRFPALPVPHVRSLASGLERPPRTL